MWNETLTYHGLTEEDMQRKTLRWILQLTYSPTATIVVVVVIMSAYHISENLTNVEYYLYMSMIFMILPWTLQTVCLWWRQVWTQWIYWRNSSGTEKTEDEPEENLQCVPGESCPSVFKSHSNLQKNALFFIYESFANLLLFCPSTFQTKRTATAGGARGIALYEDEARCVYFTSSFFPANYIYIPCLYVYR